MKILVSFPGRAGDLLWALPTLRALSRRIESQIDLQICGEFAGLVPLLRLQPYLRYVHADPRWNMSEGWQAPPLDTGGYYDQIFHLGYRRWPELSLVQETRETYNQQIPRIYITEPELDLSTPWITVPVSGSYRWAWNYGFTDAHFELKYGLISLLTGRWRASILPRTSLLPPSFVGANPRWEDEAGNTPTTWKESAQLIHASDFFLTDCSALHVLAVSLGVPVIIYEPMEARWNPIFYPLGWDGPQVTIVKGNDGKPTVDARHTADAIHAKLAQRQESHT